MKFELVVTRHAALVEYLREEGLADSYTVVMDHAGEEDIMGLNVCGVLPRSLSCLTRSFTEIPLNLPKELRGKELSLEDVRKYAGEPVTYVEFTAEDFKEGLAKVDRWAVGNGCAPCIDWECAF